MPAVCEQCRYGSVDDYQFVYVLAQSEKVCQLFNVLTVKQTAEACALFVIHTRQLHNTHMGEVLWSCAQISPYRMHGAVKAEFLAEIVIFPGVPLIHTVKQSCLTCEEGLQLEQVVAVMCRGTHRQCHSPSLEVVTVEGETEVACQGNEIAVLP